jgi:hypothetical protein
VTGVSDARFWDQAEARILDELQSYAASAVKSEAYAQDLFAVGDDEIVDALAARD